MRVCGFSVSKNKLDKAPGFCHEETFGGVSIMVKRILLSTLLASFVVLPTQAEQFVVPAGSPLHCRLTQTISTKLNFQGDAFTATVTEPVVSSGHQVVPYGSTVQGRIAWMQRPGRVKGTGAMQLAVDKIT